MLSHNQSRTFYICFNWLRSVQCIHAHVWYFVQMCLTILYLQVLMFPDAMQYTLSNGVWALQFSASRCSVDSVELRCAETKRLIEGVRLGHGGLGECRVPVFPTLAQGERQCEVLGYSAVWRWWMQCCTFTSDNDSAFAVVVKVRSCVSRLRFVFSHQSKTWRKSRLFWKNKSKHSMLEGWDAVDLQAV